MPLDADPLAVVRLVLGAMIFDGRGSSSVDEQGVEPALDHVHASPVLHLVALQRPEADTVVLVLGEQQRRQTQRVRRPQLDACGNHLTVDDLDHDVRAADDDELTALVEPEADVVVDEALGAVAGVHRADE